MHSSFHILQGERRAGEWEFWARVIRVAVKLARATNFLSKIFEPQEHEDSGYGAKST
jgi:hypothetical protein